jgi:hypothetical protein
MHITDDDLPTEEAAMVIANEVVATMIGNGYDKTAIMGNHVVLAGIAQAIFRAFRAGYTAATTEERTLQ